MTIEVLFTIVIVLLMLELVIVSMGAFGFIAFGFFLYALMTMHQTGIETFYGMGFTTIAAIGLSIFTIFAIGGFYAFKSFKKKISVGIESMKGQPAKVTQWHKTRGRIEYEGEDWRATSHDAFAIGDTCIITGYKHMTLTVKKDN